MSRELLPERRPSATEVFEQTTSAGGVVAYTMTVGYYDEAMTRPGEVFLSAGKAGTDVEVNARDGAIAISIALQHGVPLDILAHAMTRNGDGSPSGPLGAALEFIMKGLAPCATSSQAKTEGAAE